MPWPRPQPCQGVDKDAQHRQLRPLLGGGAGPLPAEATGQRDGGPRQRLPHSGLHQVL